MALIIDLYKWIIGKPKVIKNYAKIKPGNGIFVQPKIYNFEDVEMI